MNRSFMLLGAAVLLAATTSIASAQGGRPGAAPGARGQAMEQRGGQGRGMAQMLLRDIVLTDVQKDTVEKVNTTFQTQQRELMQQAAGGQRNPAMMQKRREMVETHQRTVRALLTPEQQVTFDRNVKTMNDRARPSGDRRTRRTTERTTGRPA